LTAALHALPLLAFQLSMLYAISRVQSRHVAARLRDRQYQPPVSMAAAESGDIYASIISMLIFAARGAWTVLVADAIGGGEGVVHPVTLRLHGAAPQHSHAPPCRPRAPRDRRLPPPTPPTPPPPTPPTPPTPHTHSVVPPTRSLATHICTRTRIHGRARTRTPCRARTRSCHPLGHWPRAYTHTVFCTGEGNSPIPRPRTRWPHVLSSITLNIGACYVFTPRKEGVTV